MLVIYLMCAVSIVFIIFFCWLLAELVLELIERQW